MRIVHIIYDDNKFAPNYIKFMMCSFKEYDHCFITFERFKDVESLYDNGCCFIKLNKINRLSNREDIRCILYKADKIIVSGLFNAPQSQLIKLGNDVLSKVYFHFWGGDFYSYRSVKISGYHTFKRAIYDKYTLEKCIKKCAGIINLIPGDWDEFYKIFPYDVKHFVAPMPGDPNKRIDYSSYIKNVVKSNTCKVLVGNSATKTNFHMDAFEKLKNFSNENIEIYTPLSYGNDLKYRDVVINRGMHIFKEKFHPILDFIDKEEYIVFLNTCDIGIFNNDRQQGMGNINTMLSLGKKVYMRRDTPMWPYYESLGIMLYDVSDIPNMSFSDFCLFDEKIANDNIIRMEKLNSQEYCIDLWSKVFDDIIL